MQLNNTKHLFEKASQKRAFTLESSGLAGETYIFLLTFCCMRGLLFDVEQAGIKSVTCSNGTENVWNALLRIGPATLQVKVV